MLVGCASTGCSSSTRDRPSIARARSYAALAELAAVGKRAAKDIPGSAYVRDGQTLLADAASGGPAPAAAG
jgi:hypothetical protein